jgi:NAD(P)-dependent dehydrogenase (short-subunit alcohol dehydrogenase family)
MPDAPPAGQHVLVVGGTGRMGRAVAARALAAGARVTVTSRSAGTAQAAAAELAEAAGPDARAAGVAYDATDHASVPGLLAAGPFDHAVITAAENDFSGLSDIAPDALDRLIDSKLRGTMWTARHLRPQMAERGCIVLFSGMLSRRPTGSAPVAAVSAAVEALGIALAHEWAPLRVVVVSPGALGTSGIGGHEGTADDVAAVVLAALSNPWVNATVLDVHGG